MPGSLLESTGGSVFPSAEVKVYLEGRKSAEKSGVVGVYLNGVGQGFDWANYWLKNKGETPMYCNPQALPLSGDLFLKMVDRQIELLRPRMSKADLNAMPVPLLLQKALVEAFPCPAPEK